MLHTLNNQKIVLKCDLRIFENEPVVPPEMELK